jgi:hypothetical protein
MKLLRLSAATIALIGYGSVQAQEAADAASGDAGAADQNSAPVLWSDVQQGQSSLLAQAEAVFAALRARDAAERGVELETVEVTLADNDTVQRGSNCKHLAIPGSRFMTERCIYESPGERALNQYQYESEFEQIREQSDMMFLEIAEYELAYRQSLANP